MDSAAVAEVRAFNRFWTRTIGVLNAGLLDSDYSLTEVRVLFEIAHRSTSTLTELGNALGLDHGYLSRILRRFKDEKLIRSTAAKADARRQVLTATNKGNRLMAELDERADEEIRQMLEPVSLERRRELVGAMRSIRRIVGAESPSDRSFVLRPLRAGDIGWVLERHGALYTAEHGFDEAFEALVARVLADYAQHRDPRVESGWIAEVDGDRAGSIFCMKKTKRIAQLRLLLVEPSARRMGIGAKLVDECLRFARQVGYREMMLWTKDVLLDARRIYERCGFELESEDDEPSGAGQPRGQIWRVAL